MHDTAHSNLSKRQGSCRNFDNGDSVFHMSYSKGQACAFVLRSKFVKKNNWADTAYLRKLPSSVDCHAHAGKCWVTSHDIIRQAGRSLNTVAHTRSAALVWLSPTADHSIRHSLNCCQTSTDGCIFLVLPSYEGSLNLSLRSCCLICRSFCYWQPRHYKQLVSDTVKRVPATR
jgi:hypothetical protein